MTPFLAKTKANMTQMVRKPKSSSRARYAFSKR
jgi:hypothetical protein